MRIVPWIPPLFRDRAAAGGALSDALAALRLDEPVVVGVARGGIAVAVEVARRLEAPLTAVDVERVNARGLRLGAVTAHGPPYLRAERGVPEEDVEAALARARQAAASLDARLEHETLPVSGRTTVVVDDGLITGLTLAAACRWARTEQAAQLIAATPVGRRDGLARLHGEADLVVCPHPLDEIAVVGQAYDSFDPLEEWYVAGLLADAAARDPLDRERFEEYAAQALDSVPPELRAQMSNVEIVVEDEPPPGQRLLGLYQGVPLTRRGGYYAGVLPDKITIFRGPLVRLYGHDPERLRREVRRVVLHEVAHHFGISDERLIEIDRY